MKDEGDRRRSKPAATGAGPFAVPSKGDGARPAQQGSARPARANEPAAARQESVRLADDPLKFHVAPQWVWFAPCMAASLLFIAAMSWSVPTLWSSVFAAPAIGLVAMGRLFVTLEHRLQEQRWHGYAIMLAAMGLPSLLFGLAIARWTHRVESVQWDMAFAVLAMLCLVAASLLNGRLISLVVVTLGLWTGASFFDSTTASLVALVLGGALGLYISARQAQTAARKRETEALREREQRRAGALLSEYEATGQGWFWETDRRGMISYISPRIAKLVGMDKASLIGKPFTDLFILNSKE
jgi:PAS domain-containing protein